MGSLVFASSDAQKVTDNVATIMADAFTGQPTTALIAQVATDLQVEVARINAFTDTLLQSLLGNAWTNSKRTGGSWGFQEPNGETLTYLNSLTYASLITHGPWFILDALEWLTTQTSANRADLLAYLVANSVLVDQYFTDVFNQWVTYVGNGTYTRRFGSNTAPSSIPATSTFCHANVDSLSVFTLNSTTTGTLTAGTATLAAIAAGGSAPGGGVLEAYAGNGIGASGYTITVTYTNIAGTAGQTMTFTIGSGATINTVFTPSGSNNVASIQSVAITTGTGTSGDIIKFRLKPVRSVTA